MFRVLAVGALVLAACGQGVVPAPAAPSSQKPKHGIFAAAAVVTPPSQTLGPACQAAFECCRGAVERTKGRLPLNCPSLVAYGEPGCRGFLLQFTSQDARIKRYLPTACVPEGVQP